MNKLSLHARLRSRCMMRGGRQCGWGETPRAIWAVNEILKTSRKPFHRSRTRGSPMANKAVQALLGR
jgi:hypothetical protein